jgi:uncharacterized protein (TIGR03118 family)
LKSNLRFLCMLTLPLVVGSSAALADTFVQTNLVSDIPGMAANTDPNLVDPWGVSFSPTSPIWVSDRGTGVSTLYSGAGAPVPLIVTVPSGTPSTGPTGQVFAGGTSFKLNGNPVNFIFDTLGGTIDAWNGGATASIVATTPGANFTGLALANNTLYAANFKAGGGINVFDSSFAPTNASGNFSDPNLPSGYAPFNIQNINGTLFVAYAKVTPGVPVALPGGGGYVDEFDTNGNLIRRLVSNGPLNGPWGVTAVPGTGFNGFAAGDVLVGNFSNGEINVFDANGNFLQTLTDGSGNPLVNPGLWSIAFDSGAPGANDPNALFFTAGINQGNDGLFGKIDAVPEPAVGGLAILGLFCISAFRRAGRPARKEAATA